MTLISKKDSSVKFHVTCTPSSAYIAFTSDFDYKIGYHELTTGTIAKYKFSYSSKEDYSPNPEVLKVVEYIHDLAENIESPHCTVIFSPDREDILQYRINNQFFIQKVQYGVYLFNSQYQTPLIGTEEISWGEKYQQYSFLTSPAGNNSTKWKRSNSPYLWNEKSKTARKGSKSTQRNGINIYQPSIRIECINTEIELLNGICEGSKYNHLNCLLLRKFKGRNHSTFNDFNEHILAFVELTKSLPNQIEYLTESLQDFHKEFSEYAESFTEEQMEKLEQILGWNNIIKLFDSLSAKSCDIMCVYFLHLYSVTNNPSTHNISESIIKYLKEFQSKLIARILKYGDYIRYTYPSNSRMLKLMEGVLLIFFKSNKSKLRENTIKIVNQLMILTTLYFERETLTFISKYLESKFDSIFHKIHSSSVWNSIEERKDDESFVEDKRVSVAYAKYIVKESNFSCASFKEKEKYFFREIKSFPDQLFAFVIEKLKKNTYRNICYEVFEI